jgi:hypothetical protein
VQKENYDGFADVLQAPRFRGMPPLRTVIFGYAVVHRRVSLGGSLSHSSFCEYHRDIGQKGRLALNKRCLFASCLPSVPFSGMLIHGVKNGNRIKSDNL